MMRPTLLVATGLLALLAACTSTTTTTSSPGGVGETRSQRAANDPGDPERRARVRLELASAYFGRGQNQTALEETRAALAAKPDMPEAYSLLGLIYASQGDIRMADESFHRALQLAPRDGDVMHNFGWYLCQQRRFAEADAQFQAAMAQPQYRELPRTLLAAGVCYARDNRWADAERALARSCELDPANPATSFNLSEVLYRRGEYERARFYIRRINAVADNSNAQTLWLAARIERRIGSQAGVQDFARQLRDRFPQSPEASLLDQGRFDD